ncbi:c-type heme family protein [Allorhodopirellula heiligendammensis]|uniref:Tll0287-like domain-containing protein n=1 Tax=Allorhodopirellula heiligendammensis TaxID=2714739 RepID=A0A5C6BFN6_9BACT|nr:DUF3365 domain-containing protein [Allorhodopirellula heiligendammensis]TWU10457.1 hypothetical protein Poly21_43610 [Allorhodopirellula heiligendammensis]
MKHPMRLALIMLCSAVLLMSLRADEVTDVVADDSISRPTTVAEAHGRARLLHELIHGTLQVVHRDYFDEDNPSAIPSGSLEDVFAELEETYQVKLKWLIVETDNLNVDHLPQDEFERAAVKALRADAPRYEEVQEDRYRFAGPIRLASQCLKCHVKHRLSTEDRTAGLTISMPLNLSGE